MPRVRPIWAVTIAAGAGLASSLSVHAESVHLPAPASSSSAEPVAPKPTASASSEPESAPEARGPIGPWYGWQILLSSFAASGLTFAGYRSLDAEKRMPVLVAGMTAQIAIAPFIHLAHRNHRVIGKSIAIHTALVAGGAVLGAFAGQGLAGCPGPQSPCDRFDQTDFAGFGALLGAIIAPAIDAGSLAFEPVTASSRLEVVPTFAFRPAMGGRGGASTGAGASAVVGLAGTF